MIINGFPLWTTVIGWVKSVSFSKLPLKSQLPWSVTSLLFWSAMKMVLIEQPRCDVNTHCYKNCVYYLFFLLIGSIQLQPWLYFLGHSLKLHAKHAFLIYSYPSSQCASECYHVVSQSPRPPPPTMLIAVKTILYPWGQHCTRVEGQGGIRYIAELFR